MKCAKNAANSKGPDPRVNMQEEGQEASASAAAFAGGLTEPSSLPQSRGTGVFIPLAARTPSRRKRAARLRSKADGCNPPAATDASPPWRPLGQTFDVALNPTTCGKASAPDQQTAAALNPCIAFIGASPHPETLSAAPVGSSTSSGAASPYISGAALSHGVPGMLALPGPLAPVCSYAPAHVMQGMHHTQAGYQHRSAPADQAHTAMAAALLGTPAGSRQGSGSGISALLGPPAGSRQGSGSGISALLGPPAGSRQGSGSSISALLGPPAGSRQGSGSSVNSSNTACGSGWLGSDMSFLSTPGGSVLLRSTSNSSSASHDSLQRQSSFMQWGARTSSGSSSSSSMLLPHLADAAGVHGLLLASLGQASTAMGAGPTADRLLQQLVAEMPLLAVQQQPTLDPAGGAGSQPLSGQLWQGVTVMEPLSPDAASAQLLATSCASSSPLGQAAAGGMYWAASCPSPLLLNKAMLDSGLPYMPTGAAAPMLGAISQQQCAANGAAAPQGTPSAASLLAPNIALLGLDGPQGLRFVPDTLPMPASSMVLSHNSWQPAIGHAQGASDMSAHSQSGYDLQGCPLAPAPSPLLAGSARQLALHQPSAARSHGASGMPLPPAW